MKKLLALLYVLPLFAFSSKYYISSSTGTDGAGHGTITSPLKTIAWLNAHDTLNPGDTVFLKSGDVFPEPLFLDFSGNASSHIVFTTYNGSARAVISGFYQLTGGVNVAGTNVWDFYCPFLSKRTNMLVMDGVPQAMGRWPDTGYRAYHAISGNTITDNSLLSSPNWTGAYLVTHNAYYVIDTALITNQSSGVITVDDNFSIADTNQGVGYFIENDPRTLQMSGVSTGRWYNNYTKDTVEIYLNGGLGSHTFEVPIHDTLCWFNSKSYNDVYNIDFEGSNEYSVLMNNGTGLTMTNCLFRYGAGNCFLFNNCVGAQLVNDTLDYFQNNGALVTGSSSLHNLVRNVQVNHCGLLPGMGQRSGGNGLASYTGWNWPWGFNTFQNMTILNSGYAGMCYGGDSVNITNCVVDTFCLTKIDGGGFYTTDLSFITYTYGRHLTNCLALDGQTSPSGLKYDSTDASFGFYCDSHSQSVTFTGCTGAYNTSGGIFIHGSKITTYKNNFFGNRYTQRFVAEASSAVPITGLSLKQDQLATCHSGQLLSEFSTLQNDLDNFGTVDSNYYDKTDTMAFKYFYKNPGNLTAIVAFPTWKTLTGYDAHSTFNSAPPTFAYNKTASAAAEIFSMSNLAGAASTGSVTVPAFSSLILYLLCP